MRPSFLPEVVCLALACGSAAAQVAHHGVAPLPRNLTPAEAAYIKRHGLQAPQVVTPPPTGPLWCPGEYAPTDGLLISWSVQGNWPSSFRTILNKMVAAATTAGQSRVYVAHELDGDVAAATSAFQQAGADMGKVVFLKSALDSIWIRDYGPRYAYEGDTRIVVDHVYNRPRPQDDQVPVVFSAFKGHTLYGLPLVHGGGNYHISDAGESFCTRLINEENDGVPDNELYDYTEQQIHDLWMAYQAVDTTFFDPFPPNIDSTQHIDMWMQVFGDRHVMISDWPTQQGSAQDIVCEFAASALQARGWTVHRIPAVRDNNAHYTFTNIVICNGLLLIPTYTDPDASIYNADALAAWQQACPDKTVMQIDCQAIVGSAGVMHCIVMHVPVHKGGIKPTVFVRYPLGGEEFKKNDFVIQEWNSDDDNGTTTADIYLSLDGGQTWPDLLAENIADTHAYYWSVPDVHTSHARIKVVLHDADGNTGEDQSGDFTIGTPCYADFTGDGTLDLFDFLAFQNFFVDQDPGADCEANGLFDLFDFLCYQNAFAEGC